MLSRKQAWRRAKNANGGAKEYRGQDTSSIHDNRQEYVQRTDIGKVSIPSPLMRSTRSCLSLSDAVGKDQQKRGKRPIRFSTTVHVCLILNRSELRQYTKDLHWKSSECDAFKKEAVNELKQYMFKHRSCTPKDAIKNLYQPEGSTEPIVTRLDKYSITETDSVNSLNDEVRVSSGPSGGKSDVNVCDESSEEEMGILLGGKTDVQLNAEATDWSPFAPRKPAVASDGTSQNVWFVAWKKNGSKIASST